MALLIYLGPLLRGLERIKWRVRETRARPHAAPATTEQRARWSWRDRSFQLAFWNQAGVEKEALIGGLMNFLVPQKYFVVPDTGWSGWDLKIARGLCSRALVLVCTEYHGGDKRLLRVRCTMRLSQLALFLLRGYALMTAFALLLGWPIAAAVLDGGWAREFGRDRDEARRIRRADASHHRGGRQARRADPGRTENRLSAKRSPAPQPA